MEKVLDLSFDRLQMMMMMMTDTLTLHDFSEYIQVHKQAGQSTYNVTIWRIRATNVADETQKYVPLRLLLTYR